METTKLNTEQAFDKAMDERSFDIVAEFKRTGHAMFYEEIKGVKYACELISEHRVLLIDYMRDMDSYVGCAELVEYKTKFHTFFSKPISTDKIADAKEMARHLLK